MTTGCSGGYSRQEWQDTFTDQYGLSVSSAACIMDGVEANGFEDRFAGDSGRPRLRPRADHSFLRPVHHGTSDDGGWVVRWSAPLLLALVVALSACSGAVGSSDCPRSIVREMTVDPFELDGYEALDDGTVFSVSYWEQTLSRDAIGERRLVVGLALGKEVHGLDYINGELWVSFTQPDNRVDIYDSVSLEYLDSIEVTTGQPYVVFDAGGHVLIRVAEGGALVVAPDRSVVATIAEDGSPVIVDGHEYRNTEWGACRVGVSELRPVRRAREGPDSDSKPSDTGRRRITTGTAGMIMRYASPERTAVRKAWLLAVLVAARERSRP